ncbi:hypothetical protein [Deinococcus alpinitundrae]|uniref:hypothetical protein n=1 Tax=Deinococcus alpinitundrae TaxID=468913 RepID=UPI00192A24A4|nr:hypothetical protein [Deinococcus alpinitundrae]
MLSLGGTTPLPRTNHRYGHPTPQRGVEVERKWRRADYTFPGDLPDLPQIADEMMENAGAD